MAGDDVTVPSENDAPKAALSSRQKKPANTSGAKSSRKDGKGTPGDVGQILRGAYRQTVDEAIPDDLMDLLNRLE